MLQICVSSNVVVLRNTNHWVCSIYRTSHSIGARAFSCLRKFSLTIPKASSINLRYSAMVNSLYDTCLQGIMADVFIILDWMFLSKNTATIFPAGMSHRGNQPFICCSCFLKACSTFIAHDFKGRYHDNSTEYLVKTVLSYFTHTRDDPSPRRRYL